YARRRFDVAANLRLGRRTRRVARRAAATGQHAAYQSQYQTTANFGVHGLSLLDARRALLWVGRRRNIKCMKCLQNNQTAVAGQNATMPLQRQVVLVVASQLHTTLKGNRFQIDMVEIVIPVAKQWEKYQISDVIGQRARPLFGSLHVVWERFQCRTPETDGCQSGRSASIYQVGTREINATPDFQIEALHQAWNLTPSAGIAYSYAAAPI